MNVPEDREYTSSHEWVRMDGEGATIGLTACDPAIGGELVRVTLPELRAAVKTGDVVAVLYFASGQREVRVPLSGSVVEVNRAVESNPQLIRDDPYGAGWLFLLKIEAGEEIEHLLEPTVYRELLRAAEVIDVESP